MNFGRAIEELKAGKAVSRKEWNNRGMFIVKQIPATIGKDVIPTMQSLPDSAKQILLSMKEPHIDYTNQLLIINSDARADSWTPSSSDVFAEDWIIVGEDIKDMSIKEENYEIYVKLLSEFNELKNKLKRLENFVDTREYYALTRHQRFLIINQVQYMRGYAETLEERMFDMARTDAEKKAIKAEDNCNTLMNSETFGTFLDKMDEFAKEKRNGLSFLKAFMKEIEE